MSETTSLDNSYRVTGEELRQFIERYEHLESERKDLLEQQKEVLAEARNRGYDIRVVRKLMAIRRRDPQEVSEEDAVLQLYKDALGM
ncbi:MAG: DUF2312 domain-containing protein [Paracoccaceae bacterium]|tara:strand:- start:190 stop:450 length:261 start_codon:yes stop_codon:yes gene_type:complete